jgi:acyl-CoA thioester hydrolase
MYRHTHKIRVRYGETDQMGYVYYGHYALFFEVGRVELIRSLGFTYKDLEAEGIALPVLEMNVKYIRPARYDDELDVVTELREIPGSRIRFHYEIKRGDETLNVATVTLVFIDMKSGRPSRPPEKLINALKHFFDPS